ARRGAGDDIHDRAHLDMTADFAQQLEIDVFGVVLRAAELAAIEERRFRAPGAIRNCMQRARGTHQFEDLFGHAMHVDGERNAAEANKRYAKFLFAQDLVPTGPAIRARAEIMQRERAGLKHVLPSFHHSRSIDPYRLETIALERLENLLAVRATARFHCDVELGAFRRHVEEQAAVLDCENVGAEPAQPRGDLPEHAGLVGNGQPKGDDAIFALEFAHHDRRQDPRVDVAAAQDQPDLAAAERLRLGQHCGEAGGARTFRHRLLQGQIRIHRPLEMGLIYKYDFRHKLAYDLHRYHPNLL